MANFHEIATISIQSDGACVRAEMSEPFGDCAEGEDFAKALRKLADIVEQKFHQLRFSANY